MKFFITLFGIICIAACSSNQQQQSRNMQDSAMADTVVTKNSILKRVGDSILIPPFIIQVSLSKKAEEKIAAKKETIIASAYFIGTPKDTLNPQYKKTGEFGLTSQTVELTGTFRKANFENAKFSDALYDSLADKDIKVLINVYSAKLSVKDNLLNCDTYEGKLSAIMNKTDTIKGKLIGE